MVTMGASQANADLRRRSSERVRWRSSYSIRPMSPTRSLRSPRAWEATASADGGGAECHNRNPDDPSPRSTICRGADPNPQVGPARRERKNRRSRRYAPVRGPGCQHPQSPCRGSAVSRDPEAGDYCEGPARCKRTAEPGPRQIEQQQAEFSALSKQIETVAIAISLRTEPAPQTLGWNWHPGDQLKLALHDGLDSLASYAAAMTAILFYLPAVLLWVGTIALAIVVGWRLLRWVGRRWFGGAEAALNS